MRIQSKRLYSASSKKEGGRSLLSRVYSTDEKKEKNNLLDAVKTSFSDVLSSGEGTSNSGSYFLQTESSEWGRIDITGCVEDRATIHLCYSTNVSEC